MEFKQTESKYKKLINELTARKPWCFSASSIKWSVVSHPKPKGKVATITFPKYKAERVTGFPFYKNYSRVFYLGKADGSESVF